MRIKKSRQRLPVVVELLLSGDDGEEEGRAGRSSGSCGSGHDIEHVTRIRADSKVRSTL